MSKENEFYFLKNDYLFKLIFSEEKYQKYILDVIFDIKVESKITLCGTNLTKSYKYGKAGIVDLLLEFDNKKYVLELQNQNRYNLEERLLYYGGHIYVDELSKNEDYKILNVVGILALVNHNFKDNRIYDKYFFKSDYTNKIFSDKLDIRVCNLKEASKQNNIDDKKIRLAKFIASTNINELEILASKDDILNEILEKMKDYNKDKEARKQMLLWNDNFESKEREKQRYLEVGRQEGLSSGLEQGLEQGRKNEKETVANKMLSKKMPIEFISEMTGLSKNEINKIAVNT